MVGRLLGELCRIIERQIAVDLVGGNVMVANAVLAHRLEQTEGPLHVSAQEGLGIGDGVIVMGLRRIMHDGVMARDQPVQQVGIADVAHNELHTIGRQTSDVLGVASVSQLIQNRHVNLGVIVHDIMHEVTANKPAATRDNNVLRLEDFRHIQIAPSTRGGY